MAVQKYPIEVQKAAVTITNGHNVIVAEMATNAVYISYRISCALPVIPIYAFIRLYWSKVY